MKRLAPVMLAGLLWSGVAHAQTSAPDAGTATAATPTRPLPAALQPRINAQLTPRSGVMTGDVVTLKLTVSANVDADVAVPEQSFAPFELIDRKASSEVQGETQRLTFEFSFLALEPGTHTLPGVKLRVVGPNGEIGDAHTDPQTLTVGSLLANEPNAEPKPETKPIVVMQDDYRLAWGLGGLVAAALIAVLTLLVSRWYKRRPQPVAPPPPPRPPWDLAVEKLLLLEREKQALLADNRSEEFVDRVGDVLREYLGRRYGFDGLESTTDEVLTTLERIRPHKLSLSGVSLLLEQCDLVKFARVSPDLALCDDLWNGAMGLVRATTPVAQPQELTPLSPSERPT